MLTIGVDLAAQPAKTALAAIEWRDARATLTTLRLGVDDDEIVAHAHSADKIGIDCAFGWPDEFIAFVGAHARGVEPVDGGIHWRRTLAYRETDRVARQVTRRWPLSVSTDRLGLAAMRCAGLLGRLDAAGIDVDRAGDGDVVEVYPGASLRLWGFDTTRYRTSADARALLLDDVLAAASWLDVGPHRDEMIASGDAFDAVIAALATRNAALGRYDRPDAAMLDRARREGWIALPIGALADLVR